MRWLRCVTCILLRAENKANKICKQGDKALARIQEIEAELESAKEQHDGIMARLDVANTSVEDIKRALGMSREVPVVHSVPHILSAGAVDHITALFNQFTRGDLTEGALRMVLADAEKAAAAGNVGTEHVDTEAEFDERGSHRLYDDYSTMQTDGSRRRALSPDLDTVEQRCTRVRHAPEGSG